MTTKNQKRNQKKSPKKRKTGKTIKKKCGGEGLTVRYHDKQRHKDTTRVHL